MARPSVNGWQVGRYINDIGPHTSFRVLDLHGHNTLPIAVWNIGEKGLGHFSLISQGNLLSPFSVQLSAAPAHDKASHTP